MQNNEFLLTFTFFLTEEKIIGCWDHSALCVHVCLFVCMRYVRVCVYSPIDPFIYLTFLMKTDMNGSSFQNTQEMKILILCYEQ